MSDRKFKAAKDVYCPHTGRILFVSGEIYKEILVLGSELVLETEPGCEVSRYTVSGHHADLTGFFSEVEECKVLEREFNDRVGGIGPLNLKAVLYSDEGADLYYNGRFCTDGEDKFLASMGKVTCLEISQYFLELSRRFA